MINDSSLNYEHLLGTFSRNHTLQENEAEYMRKKNKIKASSSGRKYMTASILRAAEQISTMATGRLNNDGLRGRLHLRLNDTKAINLYSFEASSSALWCHEIYLAFLSFGKAQSQLFFPIYWHMNALQDWFLKIQSRNKTDDMDWESTFSISSVH